MEKVQVTLGIDVGRSYTKCKEVIFASKVKMGEKLGVGRNKKGINYVNYKGEQFIIGEGHIFTGEDRYLTEQYRLCLLTAIALNNIEHDVIDANICVGLPFKHFKTHSNAIAKTYSNLQETLIVNGKEYTIRINNIEIFVEGAYPILTEEKGRVITIDMGGGTVDVTQFNSLEIENFDTYTNAMNKIYLDVRDYLYDLNLTELKLSDIESIINKNELKYDGNEIDISGVNKVIQQDITEVASLIKHKFDVKTADKIYIMGGGGLATFDYWKNEFRTATLVENSQFINSKIFQLIATEAVDG